jgi:hypothetical protein
MKEKIKIFLLFDYKNRHLGLFDAPKVKPFYD